MTDYAPADCLTVPSPQHSWKQDLVIKVSGTKNVRDEEPVLQQPPLSIFLIIYCNKLHDRHYILTYSNIISFKFQTGVGTWCLHLETVRRP